MRVGGETFQDLRRYAGERGLHTEDAAIADLLSGARTEAG